LTVATLGTFQFENASSCPGCQSRSGQSSRNCRYSSRYLGRQNYVLATGSGWQEPGVLRFFDQVQNVVQQNVVQQNIEQQNIERQNVEQQNVKQNVEQQNVD
jgi:hypothetical protein